MSNTQQVLFFIWTSIKLYIHKCIENQILAHLYFSAFCLMSVLQYLCYHCPWAFCWVTPDLLAFYCLFLLCVSFLCFPFHFCVNPFYTGGLFHCYMLDESICHVESILSLFLFLMENSISKQGRPRSDATSCGVWSGSALFANDFLRVSRLEWVRAGCGKRQCLFLNDALSSTQKLLQK